MAIFHPLEHRCTKGGGPLIMTIHHLVKIWDPSPSLMQAARMTIITSQKVTVWPPIPKNIEKWPPKFFALGAIYISKPSIQEYQQRDKTCIGYQIWNTDRQSVIVYPLAKMFSIDLNHLSGPCQSLGHFENNSICESLCLPSSQTLSFENY